MNTNIGDIMKLEILTKEEFKNFSDNISCKNFFQTIMMQEKFDLVHCHTPVGGVIGRIAAKKAKVPCTIYTAHGFHFYKGAPVKNWVMYYPIEKWLSRYTNVLITINKEDYERASKKFLAKKNVYRAREPVQSLVQGVRALGRFWSKNRSNVPPATATGESRPRSCVTDATGQSG